MPASISSTPRSFTATATASNSSPAPSATRPKSSSPARSRPRTTSGTSSPAHPYDARFRSEHVFSCARQDPTHLGREQIDIYQFHTWHDDWAHEAEWHEIVRELKSSGKVRFVGISIQNHQPANVLKALDTGLIDSVQVIYNIFDQSPEDELFPYCEQHGIGVIVRVPFDEGALTGKLTPDTNFPEGDFRHNYFKGNRKQEVWDAVQAIVRDTGITLDELPTLALRFCLTPKAVSTVIPGMRNLRHVAANVAASDAGPLPPEMLAKLRAAPLGAQLLALRFILYCSVAGH